MALFVMSDVVGGEGIEPSASSKYAMRSTTELPAHHRVSVKKPRRLSPAGPEEWRPMRSGTMRMISANETTWPRQYKKGS